MRAESGSIVFSGGFTQTGGSALMNGGTLVFPGDVTLAAGTLGGTGTLASNIINTGGTLAPGNSPGALTIAGDYTQGPGGRLLVELGGTLPGSGYDQLNVTGNATLDGTLEVRLFGAFTGTVGDLFDVMTYGAVTGNFSSIVRPASHTFTGKALPDLVDTTVFAYRLRLDAISEATGTATTSTAATLSSGATNILVATTKTADATESTAVGGEKTGPDAGAGKKEEKKSGGDEGGDGEDEKNDEGGDDTTTTSDGGEETDTEKEPVLSCTAG